MPEIVSLHQYPLTGAQAITRQSTEVGAGGIVGDRMFVLYDAAVDPNLAPNRVSQKQFSKLATVSAYLNLLNDELRVVLGEGLVTVPLEMDAFKDQLVVNEFGEKTPAYDSGDEAAYHFAEFFQSPSVRLAQKTVSWLHPAPAAASDRKVASVHIVTQESVAELKKRAESDEIDASRFRPNIVIKSGEEPFAENEWIGKIISIDGLRIAIRRTTARCPVPGFDQVTGENRKDVPKLYRELGRDQENKPIFGVYGVPILSRGKVAGLHVGQEVSLP